MKNRARRCLKGIVYSFSVLVAIAAGCGTADTYLPPADPALPPLTNLPTGCPTSETAADLYSTVAAQSCATASCHGTDYNDFQLTSAADLRAKLVGKPSTLYPGAMLPLVTAGDLNKSWVMYKLTGSQGGYGSKMPLTGSLTNDQLCKFVAWINSGAP